MSGRRGSVLIESALSLTLTLFLFYGALQLGIVGLEQLTADGGAFTAAHQQSFSGGKVPLSTDAVTLAQTALPRLASANSPIVLQTAPPPASLFDGNNNESYAYGFNQASARNGGVSLIQPVQTIATVTTSQIASIVLGVTGSTLSVSGTSVEPMYREINPHFDLAGNYFGTAASFSTAADPLENNAPPYFVGFNFMPTCPYSIAGNNASGWSVCPQNASGQPGSTLTALGTAEFLDTNNWASPSNGVTPDGTSGVPNTGAAFWEMTYHQNRFARISYLLKNAAQSQKAAILNPDPTAANLDPIASADVQCVYSFDNNNIGAYAPGDTGVGYPLFALHPDGSNGTTCTPP